MTSRAPAILPTERVWVFSPSQDIASCGDAYAGDGGSHVGSKYGSIATIWQNYGIVSFEHMIPLNPRMKLAMWIADRFLDKPNVRLRENTEGVDPHVSINQGSTDMALD